MLGAMAARKQTSDSVSKIAGRLLRKVRGMQRIWGQRGAADIYVRITVADLGALCGSALSQDEVKGKRTAKRRRAK